jgi:hypothetical protein
MTQMNTMTQDTTTDTTLAEECQGLQRYLLNLEHVKVRRPQPPELRDNRYTPDLLDALETLYRKTLR